MEDDVVFDTLDVVTPTPVCPTCEERWLEFTFEKCRYTLDGQFVRHIEIYTLSRVPSAKVVSESKYWKMLCTSNPNFIEWNLNMEKNLAKHMVEVCKAFNWSE